MVSVGGLASGLDTQAIVSQLLELERRPINNLERKIAQLQADQGRFTALQPLIGEVKTAARALIDATQLDRPKVVNAFSSALGVSASAGAIPSDYDLVIEQRAQAGRVASQGLDGSSALVASGPGTFAVRAGSTGALISVEVDATTTLRELTDAINAQSGDVRASIINDGTRADASRLVLTSTETGRERDVEIVTNGTSLQFDATTIEGAVADAENSGLYTGTATSGGTYTGTDSKTFIVEIMSDGAAGAATYRYSTDGGITFDDNGGAGYTTSTTAAAIGGNAEGVELAFSNSGTLSAGDRFYVDVTAPELRQARDAVFTLNGIRQTRSSNSVSDAIEGVTLDLQEADASQTLTFSVERDDGAVVGAVQGLVDAYNAIVKEIRSKQTFDAETQTGGPLLGDRTANSILSSLRRTLVAPAPGVEGNIRRLVDLGVRTGEGGQLTLDEAKLRGLLETDRASVLGVLTSTEMLPDDDLTVTARPEGVPAGDYAVRITEAAAKASVSGAGAVTTLAQDETLSFEYSTNAQEDSPTTASFSVDLAAGDTLAQVIAKLESAFATQGAQLVAEDDGGVLKISSLDYGDDYDLSVTSDVAAGAGSTQIGTSARTSLGVDIQGTIAGQVASGSGASLTMGSGDLDGLVVEYTGSATGFIGSMSLSTGLGELFAEAVDGITGTEGSLLKTRTDSLNDQVERLQDQIRKKEESLARTRERLEREFANLEVTMAQLQSQQTFLTNQLAQLG
jgi:flagellar hook-associated protein 2